jgi:Skp family chaperone for outer membrane proteins
MSKFTGLGSMSSFDLAAFQELFKGQNVRECYVSLARTAEGAERYEEMCAFMQELVTKHDPNLNEEERNLLSVAYKNVIGAKRTSWRTLKNPQEPQQTTENEVKLAELYAQQVEKELKAVCDEVLSLLSDHLIPCAQKKSEGDDQMNEACVFYLKMAGDYCRYIAESSGADEDKHNAGDYYERAYKIAQEHLRTTHPIRLGLALNYSVCYYEILKDKKKACELAKTAFDDAISKLDKLQTNEYKDSTLIMQLLRDNLTLWTSAEDEPQDCVVEDIDDDEDAA